MPLRGISPVSNNNLSEHAYCHGRLVRCGETNTQLPRSWLKRLWEMSFKTGSAMLTKFLLARI